MNQILELYKNIFVVNYLAYIYNNYTLVITTFNFIFNINIVLLYKIKLINWLK